MTATETNSGQKKTGTGYLHPTWQIKYIFLFDIYPSMN